MRAFIVATIIAAGALGLGLASAAKVTYIPAAQVNAAFAKGAVLLNNGNYQVHASRREEPGQVEVHVKDTDVIYVLDGSTTFVTGGTMVGGTTIAPDEIRGVRVEGGETRTLTKGDVMVVPNGTPHWFKEVSGPVLYYVVKVR
jgi:glc operon protein GlcG